jgi:hypothetical protein
MNKNFVGRGAFGSTGGVGGGGGASNDGSVKALIGFQSPLKGFY